MPSLESRLEKAHEAALVRKQQSPDDSGELWKPQTGKPQELAYYSDADVLGYGGAAGGGKSDLLLGLAVTQFKRSIIFRREATQLVAMVDRAREIIGAVGSFNQNTGIWRGLPGGRQLEFAGVKDPGHEQRYRGRPHSFIGFDEADQFTEYQVRFLQGWLRTTDPTERRCRVVLAFNPPASAEGRWLLQYFGPWLDPKHHNPAQPGERRWYARLPSGEEVERPDEHEFTHGTETIKPRSRTFIPARVQDNAYFAGTDYIATLQALPEPLRSQVLYGDMTAGIEDDAWQVIPTKWVQDAQSRWKQRDPIPWVQNAVGVDVARGGRDKTVISKRYGSWFAPLVKVLGSATPDGPTVAGLTMKHHADEAQVRVDVIGIGASAYDCLKDQPGLVKLVQPVNNAESSEERDRSRKYRLVNIRAASYWKLREALDPEHGEALELPPDPELLADLCAARYKVTASGIMVEPKEDIIKRLGRSPDCADAVVMAHWAPQKRRLNIGV